MHRFGNKERSINITDVTKNESITNHEFFGACKLAYKLRSIFQSTRVRYWSGYRPLNVSLWKEMSSRVIALVGQTRNIVGPFGCLPFTWANRSVHGSGKWQAKSHLPPAEKRPREPETGTIYGFEGMELKFPFEPFPQQDHLFRNSVAPRNFPLERPKNSLSFLF